MCPPIRSASSFLIGEIRLCLVDRAKVHKSLSKVFIIWVNAVVLSSQLDQATNAYPSGTTPALACFKESFQFGFGKRVSRYFFGDGEPNAGERRHIEQLIRYRQYPEINPITFLSCTNEDDQVEWMKELEEVAPFCSEYDDYADERDEILGDQGQALPFTKGFHLVGQLVGAMCPEDLDAMDESIPLTKVWWWG
jgi:hypothetical protein